MPVPIRGDDGTLGAFVVAPCGGDDFWPVRTAWRAVVLVKDQFRSPEWMLSQVKPVPLSSKVERSLLEWARTDDGQNILKLASEPGEHRVAAAVIASLRLADKHPDRALRFLAWLAQGPDDPASLRFLRRYLPGIHVLVRIDEQLGLAVPLGRDAMALLSAELLARLGQSEAVEQVMSGLPPTAPSALSRAARRLEIGDLDGVHALASGRPVVDDLSGALRVMDAMAFLKEDDATRALGALGGLTDDRAVSSPIERYAKRVRGDALRATGRDSEAGLLDEEFGKSPPTATQAIPDPPVRQPPLFGRSVIDAMDDAFARVRRQPLTGTLAPLNDRSEIDELCDQAVALIQAQNYETAEAALLAAMDRADAWIDAGGPVIDDFYVLLGGLFDTQQLTPEEIATLGRLRDAHRRAGSSVPDEVNDRLVEAQAILDRLS